MTEVLLDKHIKLLPRAVTAKGCHLEFAVIEVRHSGMKWDFMIYNQNTLLTKWSYGQLHSTSVAQYVLSSPIPSTLHRPVYPGVL
jgi:hypothetical protein